MFYVRLINGAHLRRKKINKIKMIKKKNRKQNTSFNEKYK